MNTNKNIGGKNMAILRQQSTYDLEACENLIQQYYEKGGEKKKLNEIRYTYGKKPKGICPKCKKHSLFMTNSKNEVHGIRCN